MSAPTSPFKGLSAFDDSELDALLFFGRERETEIVVANLIASRLTVLYGPSGVGKSSLLCAAVARSLRALPEQPLVVVFSRWSDDPAGALAEAIAEARRGTPGEPALAALEQAQAERDVYLILDQAEEYFLYHGDDSGPESFAELLPAILAAPSRVNVLVSLREDSLAKLDRFTGRVPGLFANTLRLDRLDRQAAGAAIARPVERYVKLTGEPVTVEPGLVDRVLDDVSAGQIEPALGGLGTVEGPQDGARIEAPYLQLVMQRLWEEERARGSEALTAATLDRLGGARHIVEEHLEGAMLELTESQKDVAARLFNHLVTPSGTKIAHEASDLADFGQVPPDALGPVLEILTERRILRSLEEGSVVRYEIFHDVLAQPVLAWRAQHRTEREIERQLAEAHRRRRRLQWLVAVVLVALALMAAITVFALSQRSEARDQAAIAKAHELEALSAVGLASDPERSLVLALEAVRRAPSETAEVALRNALLESRVRTVVSVDTPLLGAVLHSRSVLVATVDGAIVTADARTGRVRSTVGGGTPARHVSFAADGTALFTGRDGRLRTLRQSGELAPVPRVTGASRAEVSGDGSLSVVVTEGGARLVEIETGDTRETYPHPGAFSAAISADNRTVATGSSDETVRVWAAESGRLLRTLLDQGHVEALAFSSNGALVASASSDGLARIWSIGDGSLVATAAGDASALTDVEFSTDGVHVVTASKDGTVRISKADTGATLLSLSGHRDRVMSAAFSGPAGSRVVSASLDRTARVWDALYQPKLEALAALPAPVTELVIDPDGRIRATSGDRTVVLDPDTGNRLAVEPGAPPPREVVGPDGSTASIRGNTVVLRGAGRTTILRGHRGRITSVSFSPDGTLLATASRDGDVRIWNLATGEGRVLHHNSQVNDVAFSPDGRWVVTAAGRTALWNPQTGTLVVRLQGHEGPATAVSFDPAGRVILTGGEDGTVRSYVCEVCGGLDDLVALAESRLARTGRELTAQERQRYLG